MEEDTVMQDGHDPESQTEYPDPTAITRTPYPFLAPRPTNGSNEPHRQDNEERTNTQATTESSPAPANDRFTSLAEYFNLGSLPIGKHRQQHNGVANTSNAPRPDSGNVPWTTSFFTRHSGTTWDAPSLPGYHALPESDRLGGEKTIPQPFNAGAFFFSKDNNSNDRGGSQVRARGPGRPRGSRGRGWKWALKGTEHAEVFKARQTRERTGRRRGRAGRPRGARKNDGSLIDPGHEFRSLQNQAMEAWLADDYDAALDFSRLAVKANPEVSQAYEMIYQILKLQGRYTEAVETLRCAAVVKREAAAWLEVQREILALAGENRTEDAIEHAIRCCSEAVKVESTAYEPHAVKMELYIELKNWHLAHKECEYMIAMRPGDIELAQQYAELCEHNSLPTKWEKARTTYKEAFDSCIEQSSLPENHWDHLNVYLEVMGRLGHYQQGVFELKRLARWFLGRKDDVFWDTVVDDDREYDSGNDRRAYIWLFQQGRITRNGPQYGDGLPIELRAKLGLFRLRMGSRFTEEAFRHFDHLKESSTADGIDGFEDMFFEVAEMLQSYGMYSKAIEFYEPIRTLPDVPNEKFWIGLGQCYKGLSRYEEAEKCYKTILEENKQSLGASVGLARLYASTGESGKAYEMAVEVGKIGRQESMQRSQPVVHRKDNRLNKVNVPVRTLLPKAGSSDSTPKGATNARLDVNGRAPSQEINGQPAEPDVEAENSNDESADNDDTEVNTGRLLKTKRMTPRVMEHFSPAEQRTRIHDAFALVKKLWPAIEADEDDAAMKQWMHNASIMVAEFRKMKNFNSTLRTQPKPVDAGPDGAVEGRNIIEEMEAIKKRAQTPVVANPRVVHRTHDGAAGEFNGIRFDTWHHIICDLALLHAKYVEQDQCYDLLQAGLMDTRIFASDAVLSNTTLAVCIYCALLFNDTQLLTNTARQYVHRGDFRSGVANQLFAATGRFGHGDVFFNDNKMQQWLLRIIKEKDYIAMPTDLRAKFEWGSANVQGLKDRQVNFDPVKDDIDAQLFVSYAHRQQSRSHHAMPYLFRALALQPDNLIVNLSIAATFVSLSMLRLQTDRQYNIAQGLAFLYRYYDLRTAGGKACHLQEAEYNVARMWHQLGLTHQAVPAYEKVLKLSSEVQKEAEEQGLQEGEENEDFAKEAAFALQNIFMLAGNAEAAMAITEEWLVL